ncbi:FcoT family thioesterase [Gordonia crocea]|uniref:(2E)-enoyl-[ACP] glycyltransferase n=1 Tax=Gordonia crocea TaxID=589162 RepID=A0A7I9V062_9ACTN|nr:FcoT family thioesterase [Gordonia crocea]GED98576.1 hypothetical protein nbrc107697_26150 [Gordonia crocea]
MSDAEVTPQADDRRELITRATAPYAATGCRFLQQLQVNGDAAGTIHARASLALTEAVGREGPPLLSPVEFLICYNQMLYGTLATIIADRLHPALASWTLDDFWQRQLPNVVIHHATTSIAEPLDARSLHGSLTIERISDRLIKRRTLLIDTTVGLTDPTGRIATGSIEVALTDSPRADAEAKNIPE